MTEPTTAWLPLGDQILVRTLIQADRTASGLYVPQQGREKPQTGLVLSMGPTVSRDAVGRPHEPAVLVSRLSLGDLVAFGKYSGVEFTLDTGEAVLLMRETEVLARKLAGTFTLVEHQVESGLSTRTVAHEAGSRCEHCPDEPKSAVVAEERARIVEASR